MTLLRRARVIGGRLGNATRRDTPQDTWTDRYGEREEWLVKKRRFGVVEGGDREGVGNRELEYTEVIGRRDLSKTRSHSLFPSFPPPQHFPFQWKHHPDLSLLPDTSESHLSCPPSVFTFLAPNDTLTLYPVCRESSKASCRE